jgi:hypothetical protein
MIKKFIAIVIVTAIIRLPLLSSFAQSVTNITVPLGGNGWVNKGSKAVIDANGLTGWSSVNDKISVYVRLEQTGRLNIALKLIVPKGKSNIKVIVNKTVLTKEVSNRDTAIVNFGSVNIPYAGYQQIVLEGVNKTGPVYATVSDLVLSGPALAKGAAYIKDNHGNYFYWGHRGPSVHLNYQLPDAVKDKAEWFYNEITVPEGNDVQGSYFMADGFNGGYFGMQLNSSTERHILFSIWSPFETDDPKSIPDSLRIILLKKGDKVHAGEFGSEGSGGQSYLNYSWVAGKTYVFLVRTQSDSKAKITIFTAYFKEKGDNNWKLIASFKRPRSGFNLKGLYSFLENFEPENGDVTRQVYFGNQWVIDSDGTWYPIDRALFTGDATANINYRKDYSGGVQLDKFYLRNCGFFNDYTLLKTMLERVPSTTPHPEIDFNKLP